MGNVTQKVGSEGKRISQWIACVLVAMVALWNAPAAHGIGDVEIKREATGTYGPWSVCKECCDGSETFRAVASGLLDVDKEDQDPDVPDATLKWKVKIDGVEQGFTRYEQGRYITFDVPTKATGRFQLKVVVWNGDEADIPDNTDDSESASAVVMVMSVEKLLHKNNDGEFVGSTDPINVCLGSTMTFKAEPGSSALGWAFPPGKPKWSGANPLESDKRKATRTFKTLSENNTDYKKVTASCGKSRTARIKVVGIGSVQYKLGDTKYANIPDPLVVPIGETIGFKATPQPSGAEWPEGKPQWEIINHPDKSTINLSSHFEGTDTRQITVDKAGKYKVKVRCGQSAKSINIVAVKISKLVWEETQKGDPSFAVMVLYRYGNSFELRAKSYPKNTWPAGNPKWKVIDKPEGSELTIPDGQPTTGTLHPDAGGTYKIMAVCGTSKQLFTVYAHGLAFVRRKIVLDYNPNEVAVPKLDEVTSTTEEMKKLGSDIHSTAQTVKTISEAAEKDLAKIVPKLSAPTAKKLKKLSAKYLKTGKAEYFRALKKMGKTLDIVGYVMNVHTIVTHSHREENIKERAQKMKKLRQEYKRQLSKLKSSRTAPPPEKLVVKSLPGHVHWRIRKKVKEWETRDDQTNRWSTESLVAVEPSLGTTDNRWVDWADSSGGSSAVKVSAMGNIGASRLALMITQYAPGAGYEQVPSDYCVVEVEGLSEEEAVHNWEVAHAEHGKKLAEAKNDIQTAGALLELALGALAAIAASTAIAVGGAVLGLGILLGIGIVELLNLSDPPVVDNIRRNYPEEQ